MAAAKKSSIDSFLHFVLTSQPILWLQTFEEDRALITACHKLAKAKEKYNTFTWDICDGIRPVSLSNGHLAYGNTIPLQRPGGSNAFGDDGAGAPPDPLDPLVWLEQTAVDNSIVFLKDYNPFLENPIIRRKMRNVISRFKSCGKILVILSPVVKIPQEMEKDVYVVNFDLPTREEMKVVLRGVAESGEVKYPEDTDELIDAAMGMSAVEAEEAFSICLVEARKFDPAIIRRAKAEAIKKTDVLEVIDHNLTLDDIGGLENLKDWFHQHENTGSEAAREFGVKPPRSLLLIGVPGCGKSLSAKVAATAMKRPLLRLDMGLVFGQYVGESEARMRQVFKLAEAIAPCVLWIDELEKSFSGTGAGDSDGHGTTKRVFQGVLTWMEEHAADVFVVATANAVKSLPPELLSRFRTPFWVDLPDDSQREEILKIHLASNGRKTLKVNLKDVVTATREFSGRELKGLVEDSISLAFNRKHSDVTAEDLLDTARLITPISRVSRNDLAESRDWARARGIRPASVIHEVEATPDTRTGRKITGQSEG